MKFYRLPALCAALVILTACAPTQPKPAAPEMPSSVAEVSVSSAAPSSEVASSEPEPEPEPEPVVILVADALDMGEVLAIRVQNAGEITPTATTSLSFQPTFYPEGEEHLALLPVAYSTAAGVYTLQIQVGETNFDYEINVTDREFTVQHLTVDATVTANTAGSNDANNEWNQKIEPLKLVSDPAKYWSGTFMQPVQGEITTEYGAIRYTNGSTNADRHGGIDIAAALGTQIYAANAGKILFADFIQLTGNTVVLEHGLGLKSFYYHMDSLDVSEGDMVETGDPIGKVGTTGFSTGPHLHYALLVNNVYVNPWTAFDIGIG